MLKDILDERKTTHLLFTDSPMLEMFVYDTLKGICEANLESILEVTSTSSFNEMLDLLNIQPFLAKRWLFVLSYKKVKSLVSKNKGVFTSENSCFLIKVNNYKEFKEVKELLGLGINALYLAYISYKDAMWLLNGKGLSQSLMDYIVKSYSRDPEKILILIKEIDNGLVVKDRKTIVSVCGESSGSVVSFVISLLSMNVKTKKGLKASIARKSREAVGLANVYSISSFRNFILATLKDIIYIKEMYLNGDIYDSIRDIPECFDEKRLSRYKMHLKSIIKIPLEDIMKLYVMVAESGYWYKEIDVVEFIYKYYESEVSV